MYAVNLLDGQATIQEIARLDCPVYMLSHLVASALRAPMLVTLSQALKTLGSSHLSVVIFHFHYFPSVTPLPYLPDQKEHLVLLVCIW